MVHVQQNVVSRIQPRREHRKTARSHFFLSILAQSNHITA